MMAQEQDHAPKQFALYFSHMEQPDRYNDRGADLGPPTTGLLMVCIAWDRGSHGDRRTLLHRFQATEKRFDKEERPSCLSKGSSHMFICNTHGHNNNEKTVILTKYLTIQVSLLFSWALHQLAN